MFRDYVTYQVIYFIKKKEIFMTDGLLLAKLKAFMIFRARMMRLRTFSLGNVPILIEEIFLTFSASHLTALQHSFATDTNFAEMVKHYTPIMVLPIRQLI